MDWIEASRKAEALTPKVELVEREHWAAKLSGHEKSYNVMLNGKFIGRVENVREHVYRKAGRLITRSWHRKAWQYQTSDGRSAPGLYYLTRKRTVYELLYHLLRNDKLPV
jgi:hypothetical protein